MDLVLFYLIGLAHFKIPISQLKANKNQFTSQGSKLLKKLWSCVTKGIARKFGFVYGVGYENWLLAPTKG